MSKYKKIIAGIIPASIKRRLKQILFQKSVLVSQIGQDFWVYGEVFDEMRNGFFLDLGAYDGVLFSNTYILEKRYNWDGICVEANPEVFLELKRNRKVTSVNACLDAGENVVSFAKRGLGGGLYQLISITKRSQKIEI